MESRPATIVDSYLGYWGHGSEGVLVAFLLVDFGGVIRGIGGHLLNSPDPAANRAYGERFALRMMRACGTQRWSELDGLRIAVLFDAPFPWGKAIGVRDASGGADAQFLFDDPAAPDEEGGERNETLAAACLPHPLNAPPTALVSAL